MPSGIYKRTKRRSWKLSDTNKKNISNSLIGNKYCLNRIPWNKGKNFPQMIGNTNGYKKGHKPWNKEKEYLAIKGEKNPRWKGGISKENEKIRHSIEYKIWGDSIFARDGYTCQRCKGFMMPYKFVAHHILNFSSHIELRLAIDNGITLCRDCHKKFHKKYGYKNNNQEQILKFITLR